MTKATLNLVIYKDIYKPKPKKYPMPSDYKVNAIRVYFLPDFEKHA